MESSKHKMVVYMFYFLGKTENATLSEVLKFVSGSSSIPPLGYHLAIEFKHGCVNIPRPFCCKPTVSTCNLTAFLPVHYNTSEKMLQALTHAVKMSKGLG